MSTGRAVFTVRFQAMLSWKHRSAATPLLWTAALVTLAASFGHQALPAADPPPTGTRLDPLAIEIGSEDALYAAPTTRDRIGRIMAPVVINGQGPFRFIVDTGASRSAISPRLAARLGLVPAADSFVTIHGVTGAGTVPSVVVDEFKAGDIVLRNRRLPVIEPTVFADADGILGVEGFDGMRITVDFEKDQIEITRASRAWRAGEWSRVPVRLRFGRLMVANATIGRKRVKAVIDTGAERTLGNLALRSLLHLDKAAEKESTERRVTGATAEIETANSIPAPEISLGGVGIRRLDVAFADLNVFRVWGLENEPAIVIGMDALGTTHGLLFDYKRAELLIRP